LAARASGSGSSRCSRFDGRRLNPGFEWGDLTNLSVNPTGVIAGAQVGYNWQYGQFAFGAESDMQLSDADGTFASFQFSNPWFGTTRGRAGYAYG